MNMYNNCCNYSSYEQMGVMEQNLTLHKYSENTKGANIFENIKNEKLFDGLSDFNNGKDKKR